MMIRCYIRRMSKSSKGVLRGVSVGEVLKQEEKEFVKNLPEWEKRKMSLKKRYGNWNPTRKLNRQQILDIRNLVDMMPHLKTIELSNIFKTSPEAIRRILKSNWVPSEEDEEKILKRLERKRIERRKAASSASEPSNPNPQKSRLPGTRLPNSKPPGSSAGSNRAVKILNYGKGAPPSKKAPRAKHKQQPSANLTISDLID